jgi:hypothetical protein
MSARNAKTQKSRPPRIRIKTFPVKHTGDMSVQDARKAIAAIVASIPDSQLANFRGGQILVVK